MAEKTRQNALGQLEGYDDVTGEVLWTEKKVPQQLGPKKRGYPRGRPRKVDLEMTHTVLDAAGRKVVVPKGTNPDHIPHLVWPFSQVTCDHVCQKITEGHTIRDIGMMEGFPSTTVIHHWARKYPEFRKDMKIAREMRAEFYHDKAIETAEKAKKKTVLESRLQVETYKWAAGVGDPATFGNKTMLSGDPANPIGFIVETGVPHIAQEPKDVPSETKNIEEPPRTMTD